MECGLIKRVCKAAYAHVCGVTHGDCQLAPLYWAVTGWHQPQPKRDITRLPNSTERRRAPCERSTCTKEKVREKDSLLDRADCRFAGRALATPGLGRCPSATHSLFCRLRPRSRSIRNMGGHRCSFAHGWRCCCLVVFEATPSLSPLGHEEAEHAHWATRKRVPANSRTSSRSARLGQGLQLAQCDRKANV